MLAKGTGKLLASEKLGQILGQKARKKIIAEFDFLKHTKEIADFFYANISKEDR